MNLYFIRHGESIANTDPSEYYRNLDCHIELTEQGKAQCEEAANELSNLINLWGGTFIVSPFKRARDTANLIMDELFAGNRHNIRVSWEVKENPLITERAWGGLREVVESKEFNPDVHFNFFHVPPNGGESFHQCYQRVVLFFQELRHNHHKSDQIIIVSHGEWIRLALMYLDGTTVADFDAKRTKIDNCEIIHRNFKTRIR